MKKKWLQWIILIFLILTCGIYLLNIKVSTRQGINHQWQTIEIPLYLKLLDFFDRHYNYKWTVKKIIGDSKEEEDKVMKIFKWSYENIKKNPEGYPVIDDHVWHIIIRGYGANDQSSDVLTTLCNYVGMDAFYEWVYTEIRDSRIPLSFVKVNGKWHMFDPYNGIYFKNRGGNLASVEEIINGDWQAEIIDSRKKPDVNYDIYLKNVSIIREGELGRANIQSPINRLRYEIKKWLR